MGLDRIVSLKGTKDQFILKNSLKGISLKTFRLPKTFSTRSTDDVKLEHYRSPTLSFMNAQRKGVRDPFPGTASHAAHVDRALLEPFPLSVECPLPEEVKESISFLKGCSDDVLKSFWREQLELLRKISSDDRCSSIPWYSLRPREMEGAPSDLKIGLVAQLCNFIGIGAGNWLLQYVFGFPIVGEISQSRTFPKTDKPDNPCPISPEESLKGAGERFKARSKRSPKLAPTLWKEMMDQVDKGWLQEPKLLNEKGRFVDSPDKPLNNAFRFAVVQGEKVRAVDDLRASLTNKACSAVTPITLPSWEHIAQITLELIPCGRSLALGKADESDAYKKLPLRQKDMDLAVITLCGPDGRWYGCRSRSLIFGSTAAVVHYNTFSRMLVTLFSRLFGIPAVAYFEDFGFVIFAD